MASGEASMSGVDCSEEAEEEQDGDSSVVQQTELDAFRTEWRRELESAPTTSEPPPPITDEEKAKTLFREGVRLEEAGKLYEAIQFYRKAVQLIPDIEFRDYNSDREGQVPAAPGFRDGNTAQEIEEENNNCDSDDECDLTTRFAILFENNRPLCEPAKDHKMTHISALPKEIFIHILKWVVADHLDLRSLEMVSMVCQGFYLCARDPELWRLACMKVWGPHYCLDSVYPSWRDTLVWKPRPRFDGCYISKTTYVRPGEQSFQDQFYRPWHMVQYFRYLRFFPDGFVHMLTTPDEPIATVGALCQRSPLRPSALLSGRYQISGSHLTAVLRRAPVSKGRRNKKKDMDSGEQTFHVELEMKPFRKQPHWQLTWVAYEVITSYRNGADVRALTFDVVTSFPPFWFSRVRSYTAEAELILE